MARPTAWSWLVVVLAACVAAGLFGSRLQRIALASARAKDSARERLRVFAEVFLLPLTLPGRGQAHSREQVLALGAARPGPPASASTLTEASCFV